MLTQPREYAAAPTVPLPVDADDIREALDTSDPASAALASLVVFHALRIHQLRALLLTDYGDGRLHVDGRTVLLAKQARQCLRSYLDYRSRRWPHTANPHLFVTVYSANRATPVSHGWVSMLLGGLGQRLREDRIVDEIRARGGDLRQVSDLFGLHVTAALRYAAVLNHPELSGPRNQKG